MDRHNRAAQAEAVAQFRQRHVRALPYGRRHALSMRPRYDRLPTRPVAEVSDLAGGLALLQQLLHHSQRDAKPLGYRIPRVLARVVARQYPFANVEGQSFHAAKYGRNNPLRLHFYLNCSSLSLRLNA